MTLAHPEWWIPCASLWVAVCLAVFLARQWQERRRRRLLGAGAPPGARVGDALLLLGLALVGVALLGPSFGTRIERVPAAGVDVVLLLDVSRSMDARDAPPSRLTRARSTADTLLAGLAEADRAALAVFAERGVLLTPLTPDHRALRAMIPALDTDLIGQQGSNLAAGVEAAVGAFRVSSRRPRTVVVLSDGEDSRRRQRLGAQALRSARARASAVSYGSPDGAPVPGPGGALRDRRGQAIETRSHPERLAALARESGGAHFPSDRFGRVDDAALLASVRAGADAGPEGFVERTVPVVRVAPFALAALLLLLGEAARPGGLGRRRSRAGLAAPAVLIVLLGNGPGTTPELARIEQALGNGSDGGQLIDLGIVRAEAGQLEEAERAFFAAATRSRDPGIAGSAYFDLGVAALARDDLEAARDAFFDALALEPEDPQARFNLEWTLRALEAQPPPPPSGRPDTTPPPEPPPELQEERRPTPREAPQPAPEASAAGEAAPLSPDEQRRWLERVADDPRRALATAVEEAGDRDLRTPGPAW